jgi:transposase-like protein
VPNCGFGAERPAERNHPQSDRLGRAADLVDAHVGETLTYYAFPDCHWIKLRTNNPLERIMREIRRRTRVVGAFPDGQSCLNLAAARLRHIAGTQWSTRKYMNMAPLQAAKTKPTGPSSPERKCEIAGRYRCRRCRHGRSGVPLGYNPRKHG